MRTPGHGEDRRGRPGGSIAGTRPSAGRAIGTIAPWRPTPWPRRATSCRPRRPASARGGGRDRGRRLRRRRGGRRPLVSERDQNFRIAADDGTRAGSSRSRTRASARASSRWRRRRPPRRGGRPERCRWRFRTRHPRRRAVGHGPRRRRRTPLRPAPAADARRATAPRSSCRARRSATSARSRRGWDGPPAATSTRRPAARSCGTSSTCRRCGRTSRSSPTPAGGRLVETILDRFEAAVAPALGRLPGPGHPQRPDLRQHAPRRRRPGDRDRRLRGHGPHGARPRPRCRAGGHPRRPRRPGRPLRRRRGGDRRLCLGHPAGGRGGGPPRRPRRWRAWPRQRSSPSWRVRLYPENAAYLASWDAEARPMLALFEAVGLDEVRRRFAAAARRIPAWPVPAAPGRAQPRRRDRRSRDADLLERRRRVLGLGALAADLRAAAPPRARRGRPHVRPRRSRLPRRLQQRPGGRPLPPAGGGRDRPPGGDAQHEHPLPAPDGGGAGRAARGDDAGRPRHRDVRQLRQRGERPRVAPGDDGHGRPRRQSSPTGPTTASRRRSPISPRRSGRAASDRRTSATIPPPDTYRRLPAADGPAWPERAAARLDERGRRPRRARHPPGRGLRRRRLHERRHLRPAAGLPAGARPPDPRRRRALRRRRGPGRLRPDGRRAVELRGRRRSSPTSSRSGSRWATATRWRP